MSGSCWSPLPPSFFENVPLACTSSAQTFPQLETTEMSVEQRRAICHLLRAALEFTDALSDVFLGLLLPPPYSHASFSYSHGTTSGVTPAVVDTTSSTADNISSTTSSPKPKSKSKKESTTTEAQKQEAHRQLLEEESSRPPLTREHVCELVQHIPPQWFAAVTLLPFNLALKTGTYDARMRVAMRRLSSLLHVSWSVVEEREDAVSAVPVLEGDQGGDDTRRAGVAARRNKKRTSAKRVAAVGAFAVLGGAALVLTGGLAAPVIAPAFGAVIGATTATLGVVGAATGVIFGSGAIAAAFAALIGLATHAAAMAALITPLLTAANLTALFGVGGAGLAGYKGLRRTADSDVFSIRTVEELEELPPLRMYLEDAHNRTLIEARKALRLAERKRTSVTTALMDNLFKLKPTNDEPTSEDDEGHHEAPTSADGSPVNSKNARSNESLPPPASPAIHEKHDSEDDSDPEDMAEDLFSRSMNGIVVPHYTVNVSLKNVASAERLTRRYRSNVVAVENLLPDQTMRIRAMKLFNGMWAHVPPSVIPPMNAGIAASHNRAARPTGAGGVICYSLLPTTPDGLPDPSRASTGILHLWILSQRTFTNTNYLGIVVERPNCPLSREVIVERLEKGAVTEDEKYLLDKSIVIELRFDPQPRVIVRPFAKPGSPEREAQTCFPRRELNQRISDVRKLVDRRRIVFAVLDNASTTTTLTIRAIESRTGCLSPLTVLPTVIPPQSCTFLIFTNNEMSLQGAEAAIIFEAVGRAVDRQTEQEGKKIEGGDGLEEAPLSYATGCFVVEVDALDNCAADCVFVEKPWVEARAARRTAAQQRKFAREERSRRRSGLTSFFSKKAPEDIDNEERFFCEHMIQLLSTEGKVLPLLETLEQKGIHIDSGASPTPSTQQQQHADPNVQPPADTAAATDEVPSSLPDAPSLVITAADRKPISFLSASLQVKDEAHIVHLRIADRQDRDALELHRHLVLSIGISGFINVLDPRRLPSDQQLALWQPVLKQHPLFAHTEGYAVHWEDEYQRKFSESIGLLDSESFLSQATQEVVKTGKKQIKKHLFAGAIFAGLRALDALKGTVEFPLYAVMATDLIDNTFATMSNRAEFAGHDLAAALLSPLRGRRPVNLVGFSFGAKVIAECLCELEKEDALDIVQDVYLLGGTLSSDRSLWLKMRRVVAGRLVNVYNRSDWILWAMHKANDVELRPMAGLGRVSNVPGVVNVDASALVDSHSSYAKRLDEILSLIPVAVNGKTEGSDEDASPGAVVPAGECHVATARLYDAMSVTFLDSDVAVLGLINRVATTVEGLNDEFWYVGQRLHHCVCDFSAPPAVGSSQCGLFGVIRSLSDSSSSGSESNPDEIELLPNTPICGVFGYALHLQPLSNNVVLILQFFTCTPRTSKGVRSIAVALLVPLLSADEPHDALRERLATIVQNHGESPSEIIRLSETGPQNGQKSVSAFDILGPLTLDADGNSNGDEVVLTQLKLSLENDAGAAVWSVEGFLGSTEASRQLTAASYAGGGGGAGLLATLAGLGDFNDTMLHDATMQLYLEPKCAPVFEVSQLPIELDHLCSTTHTPEPIVRELRYAARDQVPSVASHDVPVIHCIQPIVIVNASFDQPLLYDDISGHGTLLGSAQPASSNHKESDAAATGVQWVAFPPSLIPPLHATICLLRFPMNVLDTSTAAETNSKKGSSSQRQQHDVLTMFSYSHQFTRFHSMVKRSLSPLLPSSTGDDDVNASSKGKDSLSPSSVPSSTSSRWNTDPIQFLNVAMQTTTFAERIEFPTATSDKEAAEDDLNQTSKQVEEEGKFIGASLAAGGGAGKTRGLFIFLRSPLPSADSNNNNNNNNNSNPEGKKQSGSKPSTKGLEEDTRSRATETSTKDSAKGTTAAAHELVVVGGAPPSGTAPPTADPSPVVTDSLSSMDIEFGESTVVPLSATLRRRGSWLLLEKGSK